MDSQEKRRSAKRESNRRHYERSKSGQDHVLLRLDKGDLARLDAASSAMGVSRAAFARMFLAPVLGAVASRMAGIDRARSATGKSLAQFLSAAIDTSLSGPASATSSIASAAADEFDALFGPTDGGG